MKLLCRFSVVVSIELSFCLTLTVCISSISNSDIRNQFCWPTLQSDMRPFLTSVRRPSVRPSVSCPSCGHISKTKQDRPIVVMKTIKKLVPLILFPHSDLPDIHRGDSMVSGKNVQILITTVSRRPSSYSTSASDHSCYQQSATVGICC